MVQPAQRYLNPGQGIIEIPDLGWRQGVCLRSLRFQLSQAVGVLNDPVGIQVFQATARLDGFLNTPNRMLSQ